MAVTDNSKARRKKGSQPDPTTQTKSKKIGRPPHGGKQCSHPGCKNKAQSKGKCRTHTGSGKCSQPSCGKQAQFKGFCAAHGGRRVCMHPGCDKKVVSKGNCGDHGGGRSSFHRTSRISDKHDKQERNIPSSLESVMPLAPLPYNQSQESMMALLLGERIQGVDGAIPGKAEGEKGARTTTDIISEALV